MNKKILGIVLVTLIVVISGFLIINEIGKSSAKLDLAVLRCDHEDQSVPMGFWMVPENLYTPMSTNSGHGGRNCCLVHV